MQRALLTVYVNMRDASLYINHTEMGTCAKRRTVSIFSLTSVSPMIDVFYIIIYNVINKSYIFKWAQ